MRLFNLIRTFVKTSLFTCSNLFFAFKYSAKSKILSTSFSSISSIIFSNRSLVVFMSTFTLSTHILFHCSIEWYFKLHIENDTFPFMKSCNCIYSHSHPITLAKSIPFLDRFFYLVHRKEKNVYSLYNV